MRKAAFILILGVLVSCAPKYNIDRQTLSDKIRGAWAGQTIGCAYGGPTEFVYSGIIPDSVAIKWDESQVAYYFDEFPGMYDDIYMDLTFLKILREFGPQAGPEQYASSFANAGYMLWHANQAARYNILNGIKAPQSGYWKNNPHADDIDFQIEADFAGIVNPGMPLSAAALCDSVGHIMNYGDGWYGGVFISTLYSHSFVNDNIREVVQAACEVIPVASKFHRVIADIIACYDADSVDWKACWQMVEERYGTDIGCPSCVCKPANIDATVNSAYVAIGLLYGHGDFSKSIEIATRCGKDSDCNPSSVGGILGAMFGYEAIPEKWRAPLEKNEDSKFSHCGMSVKDACEVSLDLALEMIRRNGGKVKGDDVVIRGQRHRQVGFEQSFEGLELKGREELNKSISDCGPIPFEGCGVVVKYYFENESAQAADYVAKVAVSIDGEIRDTVSMPLDFLKRKLEIYYDYDLEDTPHTLGLEWINPSSELGLRVSSIITYRR